MPNMQQGQIDQVNQQLRANPQYREFLRSMGVNPDLPIKLSDKQRKQTAEWVRSNVGDIGGLEIDPAGNINQDEGFSKHGKWIIPAAIGAATLGIGAAGAGPLAGLFAGGGGSAAAGGGAAAAGSGVLASSAVPTSLAMSAVPGIASGAGGAGMWGTLAGLVKNPIVRGIGSALGAGSQASADNRGAQANAAIEAEQLNQQRQRSFIEQMLAREAEGRAGANDAMRNVQRTEYIQHGAKDYQPTDPRLKTFGFGPMARTEVEKQGAADLGATASNRLATGNPIPEIQNPGQFQFDPKLLKGSAWEKLMGYAGAGLTGANAAFGGR